MNTIDAGTLGLLRRYVVGFMEALSNRKIRLPNAGDCWYCFHRCGDNPESTVTIGESTRNTVHLISHLGEEYYVPSLLTRALEVFPVSKSAHEYMRAMMFAASRREKEVPEDIGSQLANYRVAALKEIGESLQEYILKQLHLGTV